ncbi:MAG: serine hydrolase, partial [Pseudomonadota bacterium]
FPGAVYLASKDGVQICHEACGFRRLAPNMPMTLNTMFDLASLTKPLATVAAVMVLAQKGALGLEDRIGDIIHPFQETDKNHITIRQLLSHTSGLPDYRPFYERLILLPHPQRKKSLLNMIVSERFAAPPETKYIYSDIGFMILGWIIETVANKPLDKFVYDTIYQPLGLRGLFFIPLDTCNIKPDYGFAATEDCPWRKKILKGEVHDDNAYAMGGVAGHAGLFGTASEVHILLLELLSAYHGFARSGVFDSHIVNAFFSHQILGRTLGFDVPSGITPSCGKYFSQETVGHLGFTGTSFWIDLPRSIIVILLTNRVHPTRDNNKIKEFRPVFHDAIMEDL